MRRLLAAIVLVLSVLAVLPVRADPYVDNAALDGLFAELAVAPDAAKAEEISRQIWLKWFSPNDKTLATHMSVATAALSGGLVELGLETLDTVVRLYPDYAEGWNQRATLYYQLGRYDESLSDVAHVLAIEPRHYGAMSGRVLILLAQGRHDEALAQMRAALKVHPFLNTRYFFPELAKDVTHV